MKNQQKTRFWNCTRSSRRVLSAAIAAVTTASAMGAQAQLEEIVITAQKRTESLQDVPVSVSALSSNDLEGLKFRDSGEIASQVPNLQNISTGGDGFPIFSLRGVAMSDYSFNQSSPVASYVDEVYKGNPAIQGVQIFDLERLEVLRGPQGTLYGKNSTGGAVNFITRTPSFETSGYLQAGVGNFNRKEARGAFETPLTDDKLALRVAGTWVESDGWFENVNSTLEDANAVDEYGLRATLLWEPSDDFQALLRLTSSEQDATNYGVQAFNITPAGVGGPLYSLYNLLGATDALESTREGLDYFELDSDQDLNRTISNDAVALTLNWSFSDALMLTSITSWDEGEIVNPEDVDGTANRVARIEYLGEAEQFTQDLRVTSDSDGPFNYIAGAFYAYEEVYNKTTIGFFQDLDMNLDGTLDFGDCLDVAGVTLGLGPQTPAGAITEEILNSEGLSLADTFPAACQTQNEFVQERTSIAAYTDMSYDMGEALTLRLGLRYTRDETDLNRFSARILGSDGTPLFNTIPGDPEDPFATTTADSITDNEFTGKLGIDYTTGEGSLLYASYSRGYRNGSFNAQAFFDPAELTAVDPEILDAFEVGFKSQLLDGSMELNGAAFIYSYNDQQFLNVDPVSLAQTLINIDESEIMGLELEMRYQATDTLFVRAGLGLLDSEVKDGFLGGVDLSGNQLIAAPEVNFNAAIAWDAIRTDAGTLVVLFDTSYVGDQYFDVFNVDRLQQEGYWEHNARLQFDSADDNWSVAVWGKNLADEEYRRSIIDLQASFGFDYSQIGAPLQYGAEFTYRF